MPQTEQTKVCATSTKKRKMNQEEKLIDYLYGEMTAAEKQAFEQELAQNPSLQKELEALQESRAFLSELPEVQPPATMVELKPNPSKWRKWIIPTGIAASLLILLELFSFQVVSTPNGLTFSFGEPMEKPAIKTPDYVTYAEVQQLLESKETAYRKDLLLRDSIWQNRIDQQDKSIRKHFNRQLVAHQSQQKQDLAAFAESLKQEEIPEIANLVQNLLNEHQQETRLLFGEAWQSWQAARSNDLNSIKSEFANVYQNQTETDALLLNVINQGD